MRRPVRLDQRQHREVIKVHFSCCPALAPWPAGSFPWEILCILPTVLVATAYSLLAILVVAWASIALFPARCPYLTRNA